jgi:acyl-coenzyme A synthetase/AMP-(fatty) acid ligase
MDNPLLRIWRTVEKAGPAQAAVTDAATGTLWTRSAIAASAAGFAEAYKLSVPNPRGRRVVMSVENGGRWFEVFLGLAMAGSVPVPIDPAEPEGAAVAAAEALGATHLWRAGRLAPIGPRGRRRSGRTPPFLVKLTSGSSGFPKGLEATAAQMVADGRQICATMGIRPGDSNLATIPFGYSYGLGNLVMPLLLQGTRIVCASSPLPHAIATDALRHRPTVLATVPPLLRALAASDLEKGSLDSIRLVVSAGSPLPEEVARAFRERFGMGIHGFYGTSETGGIAFDRSGQATLAGRSVGAPLRGVRVVFKGRGAFQVSSPAVLGRGTFVPADRGSLNERGELVLLGRTDRVVKVAGRRIDLAEIERTLRSLPGVRDAFAHAVPGAEPLLAAAVVADTPAAELKRGMRSSLASWKVPSRILTLAGFPVTGRGKTDVQRLRHLLSAPRTATSISTLSAARQMSARR